MDCRLKEKKREYDIVLKLSSEEADRIVRNALQKALGEMK